MSYSRADRKEWFACGRKRSYYTRGAANKKAKKYGMFVYKCSYCACWHLTKRSPKNSEVSAVES